VNALTLDHLDHTTLFKLLNFQTRQLWRSYSNAVRFYLPKVDMLYANVICEGIERGKMKILQRLPCEINGLGRRFCCYINFTSGNAILPGRVKTKFISCLAPPVEAVFWVWGGKFSLLTQYAVYTPVWRWSNLSKSHPVAVGHAVMKHWPTVGRYTNCSG
jgi:hypothetical protein